MYIQKQYVVTHPGVFHADDVLACAMLRFYMPGIEIERRKATPDELADPVCFVVDTGGVYDTALKNFDHHQDKNLAAASSLILDFMELRGYISTRVADKLRANLFNYVSQVDTGIIAGGGDAWGFPGIIRNFNNSPNGFDLALDVAEKIFAAFLATAEKAVEGEQRFEAALVPGSSYIIIESGFIPDWQQLAKVHGVVCMLSPNSQEPGKWQIVSRDSNEFTIPESPLQTYRHPTGFMAVYSSKQDALAHATFLLDGLDGF